MQPTLLYIDLFCGAGGTSTGVGYDYCLVMGSDMIDYCKTRMCMKPYFT